MLLLALILTAPQALAACPADAATLQEDVAAASEAYEDWAWDDFDESMATVRADLGCLSEVVSSATAQATHRLFALEGARGRNEEQTTAAFRGLLALAPSYDLDPSLAPQGSLLRRAWEGALASGDGERMSLPVGAWFVDGRPGALHVLTGQTAVVQLLEADGGFRSWYFHGGALPEGLATRLEPVAAQPVASPRVAVPPKVPSVHSRGDHPSRTLLVTGLAAVAVGVGGIAAGEALENQM